MGPDRANRLAAIFSRGALMLHYPAERSGDARYGGAAHLIEAAVEPGYEANRIRPMDFGGDLGKRAVMAEVLVQIATGGMAAPA